MASRVRRPSALKRKYANRLASKREIARLARAVHPDAVKVTVRVYPALTDGWWAEYRAEKEYTAVSEGALGATEAKARTELAQRLRREIAAGRW